VAGVRGRDELLGPIDVEVGDGDDGRVGDQLQRIRSPEEQVVHVVRLIEHGDVRAPRVLLAHPVGVLGRHDRVDVLADPRRTHVADEVVGVVDQLLQGARCHAKPPCSVHVRIRLRDVSHSIHRRYGRNERAGGAGADALAGRL
jgi:hypothetical protein